MSTVTAWSQGPIAARMIDQRQVATAGVATRHLLGHGHRRILFVCGADQADHRDRLIGWRESMVAAGLRPSVPLRTAGGAEGGYEAGVEIVRHYVVTAVLAADDDIAVGVLTAFAEHGVDVPRDVSVMGFGDSLAAQFLFPPLTTVTDATGGDGPGVVVRQSVGAAATGEARR